MKDMTINIDIVEKDDIIYCTVEVPRYGRFYKHKHVIRESDVVRYVSDHGYQTNEIVCISGGQISNKHANSTCKLTWAFKKKSPPKKVKKRTSRAKAQTSNKN